MSEDIQLLFDCARYNDVSTLRSLIAEKGFVISTLFDDNKNSLAHYSAANNSMDVLQYIIENTSKEYFDSKNESGNTPMHWASLNGHSESVKLLLQTGCDYKNENSFGFTPVDEAIRREFTEVLDIYSTFCKPEE